MEREVKVIIKHQATLDRAVKQASEMQVGRSYVTAQRSKFLDVIWFRHCRRRLESELYKKNCEPSFSITVHSEQLLQSHPILKQTKMKIFVSQSNQINCNLQK
jgi:hypothetical protein